MHEFWRRWRRKPRQELTAPSRMKPVVDVWRLPPSKHLQPEETPPPVDDPTARTLDEVIDDVTAASYHAARWRILREELERRSAAAAPEPTEPPRAAEPGRSRNVARR